ncbi:hypothetical protein cypCar_00003868 [Cyprinus carpio]|nr:hypothetical protein cypCar_00003868 [Cyprinus carpio]
MSSKASGKEKKSGFSKKLFRRGSVRSVGSFMNRFLKTLSTLSHFGSELHAPEGDKDDGGFTALKNEGKGSVASDDSDCGGFLPGDKIPGVAGLKNHGNTCFMNAILQCLSNTELFAEYLALEQYRGDQTDDEKPKTNGVVQRKGSQDGGEVTEQLSGLVRALWTFEYTPQHSRDFKNAVAKSALQYRGNAQHDAQEFLLWLLDRVHEDLNHLVHPNIRGSIKPPIEEDDGALEGPSPPLSAGSFVQELFQAQYRSSLTCPHCQKQSNTFDPFLCISLPIPLPHTRPLYVTVVYQGKYSHCMRIGVAVPLNSTVSRLREAVSRETKIPPDQFVLTEMYYDGFHRSFCDDDDDLDIIQESDSIFAFETPETFRLENIRSKRGSLLANLNQNNVKYGVESSRTPSFMQGAMNPVSPNKNTGCEKMILLICNRACTGHQGRRFGLPFVLYLERTVTWDVLQKEILEKMRHLLRPGVYIQVGPFSLRVVGVVGITYLLPQEEQPLCHPTVERAYKSCGPGGPPHVKIVVEWDKETKEYWPQMMPGAAPIAGNCNKGGSNSACGPCRMFSYCTSRGLDRCCSNQITSPVQMEGDRRVKMQNIVRFPLIGMDMAPHVVKRSQSSWSLPSHWSPWRRPYGLGRNPDDYLYDLYAVCNHHGNMHRGHYTAYCKNSIDGQWYCFDDSEVQPVADEDVCQQTAYILFYQRRTTIPSWSANSSVAGSTSSSLCEHWVNRLQGSRPPSLASGASSRRTSLISLAESVEFPGDRSEDDGGFSTRPFVRSIQRQSLSSRSSVTSPLAFSENGMKPSWSLSQKLQMRSNSPSRFSLDSRSSPPLERIGETCDDKVSTSCFGSYSRHERQSSSKAPLAMMEGNGSDDGSGKRILDEAYCRAPTQSDRKSSKGEPVDNNNQINAVDQNALGALSKEQKRKSSMSEKKAEGSASKKSSTKTKGDQEKPSKKRQSTSSVTKSPSSQVSSSPQVKGSKATNLKEKSNSPKSTKGTPSGTPSKRKESLQAQESPVSGGTKGKPSLTSTPQSSASPSPTSKKSSSVAERNSVSGKKKLVERGSSKDLAHTSPLAEKSRVSATPQTSQPKTAEARRPVRSSSSSSSITSLRSPSVSSRDLRRSSKSEDKGLSFFKSALRQKETRRSADLGKTTILAKKAVERTAKSSSQWKLDADEGEGSGNSSLQVSPEPRSCRAATDEKESSKTSTPNKRSLLPVGKSKSSNSEASLQSPINGKRPLEKISSSKKLSSSMQSSARATQTPQ